MSTRFTEFHAPFQERPSPNDAYSTYFRKIYKFPYFREICFLLNLRFCPPSILNMMHLCIMLYRYWTPLAPFKESIPGHILSRV